MCSDGFLGREMVDECSGDAEAAVALRATACACTVLFDGTEVFCVSSVFEIQDAAGGDGVAKALYRI